MPTTRTTTVNGSVVTDSGANVAQHMLADMIAMETTSTSRTRPQILPVIGAITGILGTAIAAGQLGLDAASAANSGSGALEVEIRNFGSNYLAPFSFDTNHVNMTSFPGPIAPGSSDSIVVTHVGGFTTGASDFSFAMLIANNTAATDFTNTVTVEIKFEYSDARTPGLWKFKTTVDSVEHDFTAHMGLMGVQFTPTDSTSFPKFDMFFASIESGGGDLLISIYDQGGGTW